MKTTLHFRKGFTVVELLVVIAVVMVLAGMLFPARHGKKARAPRITCISNLKQIGIGYRIFADDHNGLFPQEVSVAQGGSLEFTNASRTFKHFQAIMAEIGSTKVLVCPADKPRQAAPGTNIFSNENLSYFAVFNASQTSPGMMLAGDRNLTTNGVALRSDVYWLITNAPIGWTEQIHRNAGNVALADGSAQQLSNAKFPALLKTMETNHKVSVP